MTLLMKVHEIFLVRTGMKQIIVSTPVPAS